MKIILDARWRHTASDAEGWRRLTVEFCDRAGGGGGKSDAQTKCVEFRAGFVTGCTRLDDEFYDTGEDFHTLYDFIKHTH